MAVMTTGNFPKSLVPGVKKAWGDAYKDFPAEYSQIFKTVESDRAYEEYVSVSGFAPAVAKAEGGAITYDDARQGFTTRITNLTFALGFKVTQELVEDGKWEPKVIKNAQALKKSFMQAKENIGGLVLSRAFNSGYVGGDGKELCATDHPNKAGGTFQNELTTAADLSETSIEQLLLLIASATDDRGNNIMLMPQALVVSAKTTDFFEAQRILNSTLQSGTANNDINALKGVFPKGIIANHYFDAGNGAWFITTDAPEGMLFQNRVALTFGEDNDSDTFNMKFFGRERYGFGWADPKGIYGTPGAA